MTLPFPLGRPEWEFDGRLHVRVLDPHGYPIEKTWIDTSLSFPYAGWATSGAPLYTSTEGTAIVKYPSRTDRIMLIITKEGWQSVSKWVRLRGDGASEQGVEITFRLSPSV